MQAIKERRTATGPAGTRTVTVEVPEKSLSALLREAINGGATPDQATDEVLAPYAGLPITDKARPIILQDARKIERDATRLAERKAFDPARSDDGAFFAKVQSDIQGRTFAVGGVQVTWGKATAAQHRARLVDLERHLAGVIKTIRQHQIAIQVLEEHGAECLEEIPDWLKVARERIGLAEQDVA